MDLKDFKVATEKTCQHCMHLVTGPMSIVLPDGHVSIKCCKCPHTTHVHRDHFRPSHGGW